MIRRQLMKTPVACILATAFSIVLLAPQDNLAYAEDGSVKPGINDKFLSDDLDIEEWTGRFEGESREIYANREAIVAALGLTEKQRVADVGAGTGFFSELLADAVGPNGLVWALEISPKFLAHLEERFAKSGHEQIEVVENSDRSTGLAESSVDLVFICDVYHHFEYPNDILENLKHVLRGGGTLVVVDFERVEGESAEWVFDHVRAGKSVFREEIEKAGFKFVDEIDIDGLKDNYILKFRRP